MAKVYVSSTIADLEPERELAMDWLVAAGHQPVHSYRPNSETVRESCLDDIDGCDLYVLILGYRYGFQPEDDNPDNLSITHLEFRRAGQSKIPRVALLSRGVQDIGLSDLLDPQKAALVNAFQKEVRLAVRLAEFRDPGGLILGLSTGVQAELGKLRSKHGSTTLDGTADDPRVMKILATLADEVARKNQQIDQQTAENISLRGRVTELEDQLRAAIVRTVTAAAAPDAGEAAIAAADALEAGDTRPAEALLKSQERDEVALIESAGVDDAQQRREAAALAREQGALAMGHDVRAALLAFQRAAEYEPDDVWTHFFIGDLQVSLGDLSAAMQSFRKGRAIAEALAELDLANTVWHRDLSVSNDRIGDVLVAQGDGPGALAAYRNGLTIREALAARDLAKTRWQRDLSVSHNRIGDVLVAQGDGPGALAAYRKGLTIAEALAALDPANTDWQRDLSVSHDRIGDVLVAQGDGSGALAAYRKGLTIADALAARDPTNVLWQTDVAVSCWKLGTLVEAKDVGVGREHLLRGRAILAKLKEEDRLLPNQDWIDWFDTQLAQLPRDPE